jgi:hypothetical protein
VHGQPKCIDSPLDGQPKCMDSPGAVRTDAVGGREGVGRSSPANTYYADVVSCVQTFTDHIQAFCNSCSKTFAGVVAGLTGHHKIPTMPGCDNTWVVLA